MAQVIPESIMSYEPPLEDDSDVSAVPKPGDLQDAGVEDEPNL